jgi:Zn-dependent peptidase ImmA (M78 family)/transcriptional regulator with XRE-family HTH domain
VKNKKMYKVNYEWLQAARELRQLTQDEVSKAIGISQGKLSKAEHCIQELPDDVMDKLSQLYDLPISFFRMEWDPTPPDNSYFRKHVAIPAKELQSFESTIRILKNVIEKMMDPIELPEYDIGTFKLDESTTINEIVKMVRFNLKVFRGTMPNMATLLENHGIIIYRFDFGTDKIDGLSCITNSGRRIIFVNNRKPNDRIRFSLAHELGHMVMHIGRPIRQDVDYEEEANQFASELLLPEEEISPLLRNLDIETLCKLKRRWHVSMHFIARRAYDLKLITDKQYRNFMIFFSKKGYSKTEPIFLPLENPSLFHNTLEIYREQLGYSNKDLMNAMCINSKDFEHLFVVENSNVLNLR